MAADSLDAVGGTPANLDAPLATSSRQASIQINMGRYRTSPALLEQLSGAFISSNPGTAEPFLQLNETHNDNGSSNDDSNTGAITGGVVGGIVGLAIIILGILWYYRRRRRAVAAKLDEPAEHEVQELPAQEGTVLKNVPPSYDGSPAIGSWQSSPAQTQYSPRAPSYWSELPAKHVSYELPGSGIQTELEDNQTPTTLKPPQESRDE
ncbi:hypothetical protein PRZ48_000730 [Zasmidium cellare]|uniref:Uncharacterized protein n=1 Tax=Zasmidium cellare TaxID=395010 RepID=A0ABR0F0T0_ZASCE|nr:hypothetical protein PRZ48_000730 [Zasmidium cellare]